MKWCKSRSPIDPVNLAKLCIISLFLFNEDIISKQCKAKVILDTRLPTASLLYDGQWAIAKKEPLQFSVVCEQDNAQSVRKIVKPPLSLLYLPPACVGLNKYLTLTSTYEKQIHTEITDEGQPLLRHLNITGYCAWSPLTQKFPNFTQAKLPKSLPPIKEIPMNHLINELRGMTEVIYHPWKFPTWGYVCIALIVLVIIVVAWVCYKKQLFQKLGFRSAKDLCGIKASSSPPPAVEMSMVTASAEQQTSADRGTTPSAPNGRRFSDHFMRSIYPSLSQLENANQNGVA